MNILKLVRNSLISGGLILRLAGCAKHLGQFTAASTQNIRNLHYSVADNTVTKTEGEACARNILGIPINQQDDLLQRAMDNAIENGRKKGIDGDLLVNVRIKRTHTTLILYNDTCYIVTGDLVKIEDK
jgi:hypothetical protein